MPFLYRIRETQAERFVEIEGFESQTEYLTIPARIEGLPVRRVASHAFEGRGDLVEISVPDTVREFGTFAFHNLRSLRKIQLYDSVQDYAHGVLRHCAHLEEITLYSGGEDFSLLKQILEACEEAVSVLLCLPDGQARLAFPDYALIASENTMARTIQFAYEGGGYAYRQCVRKRGIRYREYDGLFSFMEHDDPDYAAEIAIDRLMYPRDLDERSEQTYRRFLTEHAREALSRFAAARQEARILWMMEQRLAAADPGAVDEALRIASSLGASAICAVLMDGAGAAGLSGEGGLTEAGGLSLEDW